MLDKWLADLAEVGKEKTASDQFGEALEQLSAQELEAIYELQGEKIKEAGWAGRAAGGLTGAIGGGLGGSAIGAGLGGAAGALYAPQDRHMEGFWQGTRRGAEMGGAIGALGGGLAGVGLGGLHREGLMNRLALSGKDKALALGGLGAATMGAPIGGSVAGGMAGANVNPDNVIVVERKTKSKSKKKGKEKKSYDLGAMRLEKDAAMGEFLRKHRGDILGRMGKVLKRTGERLDPTKPSRMRYLPHVGVGTGAGTAGYVGGREHEKYRAKQRAGKSKTAATAGELLQQGVDYAKKHSKTLMDLASDAAPKARQAVADAAREGAERIAPAAPNRLRDAALVGGGLAAGGTAGVGGYHLANKRKQAALLKAAAKRGLMRRMVEGIGGVGLGKQRKEIQKRVASTSRSLGQKKRVARAVAIPARSETSGVPQMRKAMREAMRERSALRERSYGRGVKAIGGVGSAAALGGMGYGGYRMGKRDKKKQAALNPTLLRAAKRAKVLSAVGQGKAYNRGMRAARSAGMAGKAMSKKLNVAALKAQAASKPLPHRISASAKRIAAKLRGLAGR